MKIMNKIFAERKREPCGLLALLFVILLVQMPISAFVADSFQGFKYDHFSKITIFQYLFFTGFAAIPQCALWFCLLKKVSGMTGTPERLIRWVTVLLTVLVSYYFSVEGYLALHTDAQAALAFVILPFITALIPVGVFGLTQLLKLLN